MINPADVAAAATLLALLCGTKRAASLRDLVSGWDMLQASTPSCEELETAASVLVGSRLALLDQPWSLRLTEAGDRMRKSVPSRTGMRQVPRFLMEELQEQELSRAEPQLPPELYAEALADYVDRAERQSRLKKRWWWPDPIRRG